MKKMLTSILMTTFFSTTVYAKDKVIFACTLSNQKQVLVTEKNNRYRYQFGKIGRPELVFENDKKTAIARSPLWNGVGGEIWSNLVLQNGDYFYTVFTATDRMTDEHPTRQGMIIEQSATRRYKDTHFVAQLQCDPQHTIVENIPEELLF